MLCSSLIPRPSELAQGTLNTQTTWEQGQLCSDVVVWCALLCIWRDGVPWIHLVPLAVKR